MAIKQSFRMSHLYVLLGGVLFKEWFIVHSLGLFQKFNRDPPDFSKAASQRGGVGTALGKPLTLQARGHETVPSAELISNKTLPPA